MNVNRWLRLIAGSFVLLSLALGHWVSGYFYLFTGVWNGIEGSLGYTSNGTLIVGSNGNDTTFSGNLSDGVSGGLLALEKTGNGTLTLAGTGTAYTGGTLISGGTLQLNSVNAMNNAGSVTMTGQSTFRLNGFARQIATLNGTANAIIENGAAGNTTLTVSSADDGTFAGTLRNGGSGLLRLTKAGSGTLILTGTSSYTGLTTVTGGVLAVAFVSEFDPALEDVCAIDIEFNLAAQAQKALVIELAALPACVELGCRQCDDHGHSRGCAIGKPVGQMLALIRRPSRTCPSGDGVIGPGQSIDQSSAVA